MLDLDFQTNCDLPKSFLNLWKHVWREVTDLDSSTPRTVADIAVRLGDQVNLPRNIQLEDAVNLVFAVLGWQTMLYRPDTGSCSPSQLAIVDETNGHRGQAHMSLRQSTSTCSKPLHEFLVGFGVMLPCRNFSALRSDDDQKAFREFNDISGDSFNAHFLTTVGGVQIRWIDNLSCHLEFDSSSNTLYLFRYPSFCIANLLASERRQHAVPIHACASPNPVPHWGTVEDVGQLLHEILLSYRLLFGQSKGSRRCFRTMEPFLNVPVEGRDKVLDVICGKKTIGIAYELPERGTYDLRQDFPVLRSRLVVLMRRLSTKTPQTWKELWRDRRDSASWFTFWIVLIIGGIGIFLAFVQVVLQVVQIAVQMG